jgi:anaerobic selenocysteine-containing dehydrogenase
VKALERLDVLVVSDVVHTATTRLATHVFPAADFTERPNMPIGIDQFLPAVATQYGRAIVEPKHRRKPTWWPIAQVARRMGVEALPPGFDADTATDDGLLADLAARGPIDFDVLRAEPSAVVTDEAVFGWVEDSLLPNATWRLAPSPLVDQLAKLEDPAPLALIPRRQQRHFNSQLALSLGEGGAADAPLLLVSPDDARSRDLSDGDEVVVHSVSGSVSCLLSVEPGMRAGTVSLPHGFDEHNVGYLTSGTLDVDPLTGMVLQSGLSVTIVPAGT